MGARNIRWTPSAAFDATPGNAVPLWLETGLRLRGARFGLIAQTTAVTVILNLYEDAAKEKFVAEWSQDISTMTAADPATDFADKDFGGQDGPQFDQLFGTLEVDAGSAEIELVIEVDTLTVRTTTLTTAVP